MTAPVISAGDMVERRVELITNALLHLPIRGAELQFAARQVELALRPEMDEAAASIQQLEPALKPFAEVGQATRSDLPDSHPMMHVIDDWGLDLGHFRRARSSLNQNGGKP